MHSSRYSLKTHGAFAMLILGLLIIYSGQGPMSYKSARVFEGAEYARMAEQFEAGTWPITGRAPFVYRLLTPALAASLPTHDVQQAFTSIHLTAGFTLTFMVYLLAGRFTRRPLILFFIVILFATSLLHPFRFGRYFPFYVDSLALCFCALILYLNTSPHRMSRRRIAALSLLTFTGVLARDMVLGASLCGLLAPAVINGSTQHRRFHFDRKAFLLRTLPCLAGAAALALSLALANNHGTNYHLADQVQRVLRTNTAIPWRLAAPLLAGWSTALLVPILLPGSWSRNLFQRTQVLAAFCAASAVTGMIGGFHNERFFFWGLIALLPIAAGLLDAFFSKRGRMQTAIFLALLLLGHALLHRVFAPIPDVTAATPPASLQNTSLFLLSSYGDRVLGWDVFTITMSDDQRRLLTLHYAFVAHIACIPAFAGKRRHQK